MGNKIYTVDKLRKSGSSLMVKVTKKDFELIGKEDMYKPGTKVRVVFEILPDDWEGELEVIQRFVPEFEEVFQAEPEYEEQNPFKTSVKLNSSELQDKPKGKPKNTRTLKV